MLYRCMDRVFLILHAVVKSRVKQQADFNIEQLINNTLIPIEMSFIAFLHVLQRFNLLLCV